MLYHELCCDLLQSPPSQEMGLLAVKEVIKKW